MFKNFKVFVYLSHTNNPYENLAIEEVLASDFKDDNVVIFFLWQNANTVVVGRNQNIYEEVSLENTKKDCVNVVRRLSGGGAVFQDLGNFCYTFIVNKRHPHTYQELIEPIVLTLNRLGVPAKFIGKNDIKVGDKKISGNCQYILKNAVVHHGTILFDVDLPKMQKYLIPNQIKLSAKGIKSRQSPVMNIKPLLPLDMNIGLLWKEILIDLNLHCDVKKTNLKPPQLQKAKKLVIRKYNNKNWIFGSISDFNYQKKIWLENKGFFDMCLNIENNVIKNINFYGDFLGYAGMLELQQKLINLEYDKSVIKKALLELDLIAMFGNNIVLEDILSLIWLYNDNIK